MRVNELYGPVLQGEGVSIGTPVLFIRMAMCNLHCLWCDSSQTWNFEGTKFDHDYEKKVKMKDEVHDMTVEQVRSWINDTCIQQKVKRVVLSGGEPLLQQKELAELMRLSPVSFEIETNGTIMPSMDFDGLITQYNVSPKLQNSGNPLKLRYQAASLKFFAQSPKAYFKYVVNSEEDMREIIEHIVELAIPHERILLMPLGHTQETQAKSLPVVEQLCLKYGFRLSPRLHVLMHDYQRKI